MGRHAHTRYSATDLDHAKVAQLVAILASPSTQGAETPASARQREDAIRQVEEFGVSFDGHQYRYQEYHYDLLADALNYALLDRASPTHRTESGAPMEWLEAEQPAAADRQRMEELAVTFDGHCYLYGGHRYDHLADALSYAQLQR